MSEKDLEKVFDGFDLAFDSHYRDIRDKMNEKYFDSVTETCIFALAIGIKLNLRIPRVEWKATKLSWSDLQRVSSRYGGFAEFFEYLGLKTDRLNTTELMNDYVTGGLKFIDDNYLYEDGNLGVLAVHIPSIFEIIDQV